MVPRKGWVQVPLHQAPADGRALRKPSSPPDSFQRVFLFHPRRHDGVARRQADACAQLRRTLPPTGNRQ
jgi:hypothetical protein